MTVFMHLFLDPAPVCDPGCNAGDVTGEVCVNGVCVCGDAADAAACEGDQVCNDGTCEGMYYN